MVKSLASIALLTMLLIGCAKGTFSGTGPPLVQYSPQFQHNAISELKQIEHSHPHVTQFVVDYGKLRDQIRAGRKVK